MKKILCLMLVVFMLATLIVSCKKDEVDEEINTETTIIEDESSDELGSKLKPINMEGFSFNILSHMPDHFGTEEIVGTAINDAVYNRDRYLESKYSVELSCRLVSDGGYKVLLDRFSSSGEDAFHMMTPKLSEAFKLSCEGYCLEVNELPYLDLDQPYWWKDAMDDATLGGKSYVIINDSVVSAFTELPAVMFNKELAKSSKVGDLYELVKSGKWTIEEFVKLSKSVYRDKNGNGVTSDDIFGTSVEKDIIGYIVNGTEIRFVDKDQNGLPVLNFSKTSPSLNGTVAVMETIANVFNEKTIFKSSSVAHSYEKDRVLSDEMFSKGNVLFVVRDSGWAEMFRIVGMPVGLLPMPKADAAQQNYANSIGDSSVICLSISCSKELDKVGRIIEDMACASGTYVRGAYEDLLLRDAKGSDEDSREMIQYITGNVRVDLSAMLNVSVISSLEYVLRQNLAISIALERYESGWQTQVDRAIAKINK